MILRCSRGHVFDTTSHHDKFLRLHGKGEGDRCPEVMTYDVMSGTGYCRRVLKRDDSAKQKTET